MSDPTLEELEAPLNPKPVERSKLVFNPGIKAGLRSPGWRTVQVAVDEFSRREMEAALKDAEVLQDSSDE